MVEKCRIAAARFFPAGWHVAAKPCDSCKSAPSLVFCHKHTAFLCVSCDMKLHSHTTQTHERVLLCEVCEHAPAVVTCKADAAGLCVTCDRDIHSANPLASRHERVPVATFYDSAQAAASSSADNLLEQVSSFGNTGLITSSVIPGSNMANVNGPFSSDTSPIVVGSIDQLAGDPFFDFGFAMPAEVSAQFCEPVNDSIVAAAKIVVRNSYNKSSSQSHSHSVSSSSLEVCVVPEKNSLLHKSKPCTLPLIGGESYGTQKVQKFCAIDRQARVLRYREKRKKRKFEKKIRYASRKAYAEMRPRIKGRFIKRTESTTELDVDRWLFTAETHSSGYGAEAEYGVVPSF